MSAQPDFIALSGKGEAKQSDDRSVAPSATDTEDYSSTAVDAPKVGDAGLVPSFLTGSGVPAMGIFVPSTLEQSSFSSFSTSEIGSRTTQQGVLPVASSATVKHHDGPEVQLSLCPDVYPTTCTLSSGKPLPLPSCTHHGTESDLHQGRPPVGRLVPTLPVGHVGAHPDSLRASGGLCGSSHHGEQLSASDFRFAGMPSLTSGSAGKSSPTSGSALGDNRKWSMR